MLNDVMGDYLKAIYTLQIEQGPPASTSGIVEYLGKIPPTVMNMAGKLEGHGLVDREKYKSIKLTAESETVALGVLRHHRLLEAYPTEHLDYLWSEVHNETNVLEHHINEEFERRTAAAPGEPETDPHGDPIPSADLTPPDSSGLLAFSDCEVGDRLVVIRASNRDPAELEYLSKVGVTPGTTIEMTDIAPFGIVTVLVGDSGREQSLPESAARAIRVRSPDEPSNEEMSSA